MDAELRFTEEVDYIIQEEFEDNIQLFPFEVVADIIRQIEINFKDLPQKDFVLQKSCGVSIVSEEGAYYFLIQYMKTKEDTNILIDIEDVDSDTFLDYILLKKNFIYGKDIEEKSSESI